MKTDDNPAARVAASYYGPGTCTLDELKACVAHETDAKDVPLATKIAANAPVYDCDKIRELAVTQDGRRQVMAEWIWVLRDGPGIVVLKKAFDDTAPVDASTAAFERMILAQRNAGTNAGDHFAKPGANDRIWNALEKLCLEEPEVFAAYYANEMIALISEAWLGPCYQVTSQVNVVNPGGTAQTAHRDYHLGFQASDVVVRYPAHVHLFSPMLTLQGAVAHCDMPIESGPTLYMPFSQAYGPGYLAAQEPDIRAWFNENCMQLPLKKGDAVFFNPALLHAAGTNRSTGIRRMANLLQVSSAYGRAMETVDRTRMIERLYPVLRTLSEQGGLSPQEIDNVIAASAEGYAFPTNLDRDPPIGGLAPKSQQDLTRAALSSSWDADRFLEALQQQTKRRLS